MVIAQIDTLNKGRIRIWLEEGFSFTVYKKEIRHLELEVGTVVTVQQYQEMIDTVLIPRAKKRALYLIEKKDRTEMELREKLNQNEYPQEVIEAAVNYVKRFHYIDDLRYACNYIRYRSETKSIRQIVMELYKKGISKDCVERAFELEEQDDEDESSKIKKWLDKKKYVAGEADVKQKQKIYQFLLRKGFKSQDILKQLSVYGDDF